jgi:hypothetical protein
MSAQYNPYESPQAPISAPAAGPASLATRSQRFASAFIDNLVLVPIYFLQQEYLYPKVTAEQEHEMFVKHGILGGMKELAPPPGLALLGIVIVFAVFLAVNFAFLKNGQTLGKKVMKLQVQNRNGDSLPPVQDLILKRYAFLYAVPSLLAIIHPAFALVWLLDALLIFRTGRNTLHDDLAKTKVVKLGI